MRTGLLHLRSIHAARAAASVPPAVVALLGTSVAFAIGLTLPDADLHLWLGHRSGLTHSILPAALLLVRRAWRTASCGMAAGTGLHLAADSFPNRMVGYATVKLPGIGALPAAESYAWLALNALAALGLAVWLVRRLHAPAAALLLAAGFLCAGAAYLWRTDGGWPVLAIAAALGWAAWRARRGITPPLP